MIGRGSVTDRIVARTLAVLALSSIAILASITFFIFREGAPLVHKVGPAQLLRRPPGTRRRALTASAS